MTTIVNNPNPGTTTDKESNSFASLITVILLIVALLVIVYYLVPALRGAASSISQPVQIPSKIDVNVNGGNK